MYKVEGSGSAETKLASTVLLRTFLNPDHKEFYTQIFDLAAASLRPRKHTDSSTSNQSSIDIAEPPDPLTQARITIFKQAFPLAREELKKSESRFNPQFLDATDIQLYNAFLFGADLKEAWMPGAFLAKANLKVASLNGINLQKACLINANLEQVILSEEAGLLANLDGANLTRASLNRAILIEASLRGANLPGARLNGADLTEADLTEADLSGANLTEAHLSGANLTEAHLNYAHLSGADLRRADLRNAQLEGANPEDAASLEETKMSGVVGLPLAQREACIMKGAIFDEVQQTPASDIGSSS